MKATRLVKNNKSQMHAVITLFPLVTSFLEILHKPSYQPKIPLDPLMPYHLKLNLHSNWLPFQVYDILKKLLNRKATGIHEIPNKILKACSGIISPHLSQIFRISLTTKCYPDSLKLEVIRTTLTIIDQYQFFLQLLGYSRS